MKRASILFSHIGAGSDVVFNALCSHPNIDGFKTGSVYDHYESFVELTSFHHKNENACSIWMDEVLHNFQFTCKSMLRHIYPVFVIREPRGSLTEIMGQGYDAIRAANYYCYRLRGLCEYAGRVKPFVIVYDEMNLSGIESYFEIKGSIQKPVPKIFSTPNVPSEVLKECEMCFEKHLGHFKLMGT